MTRIAIVTGAASGIDGQSAGRVAGELARDGPRMATAAAVDVRDAAAVHALVHGTGDRYGRLDVMVSNAGIGVGGEAGELLLAHWDQVIDVNLRGVVHGVHAAYPVMIGQWSGQIVNTASLAGLLPALWLTPYAMIKHAVVGLSRQQAPTSAPGGPAGGWLAGPGTGRGRTVTPLMASRPGSGAVDGSIGPAALPSRVKGARPWPR